MRTQRVIGNRQLNCAVIPQRASADVTTTQIALTVSVCVCLCWYSYLYLQPCSYCCCTFISSNDRTKLSRSRIFRYIYLCILIFANYLHPLEQFTFVWKLAKKYEEHHVLSFSCQIQMNMQFNNLWKFIYKFIVQIWKIFLFASEFNFIIKQLLYRNCNKFFVIWN